MPKVTFLPNPELCPNGITVTAKEGDTICRIALDNNIKIDGTYYFNDDEKQNKFNLSTKISKKGSDTKFEIDIKDKIDNTKINELFY